MPEPGASSQRTDRATRRGAVFSARVLWLTWMIPGTFLVHGVSFHSLPSASASQLFGDGGIAGAIGLAPALTAYITRRRIAHRSG